MHEKVLGFVSFGKERKGESENEQARFFSGNWKSFNGMPIKHLLKTTE